MAEELAGLESESVSSDRSLVRRFRNGENQAATELYLRYAVKLESLAKRQMSTKLAARLDAEDVVQSVFRTFFRRAGEPFFDAPTGNQIWQLLLVIALNKVRHLGRFHRQQCRDVGRTVSAELETTNSETVDHVPLQILEMVVTDAMGNLPAYQRQMIELRLAGHTAEEIAIHTKRCSRTVERILKRFREDMKKHIDVGNNGSNS